MSRVRINMATVVVPDYEQGLAFFRGTLGLDLLEDVDLGAGKRWLVVGAEGGARLLIAQANNEEQRSAIGRQAGGRVAFFLHTEDFDATYRQFADGGVIFEEQPREERYGSVAVFSDPFGNRWDLIAPRKAA